MASLVKLEQAAATSIVTNLPKGADIPEDSGFHSIAGGNNSDNDDFKRENSPASSAVSETQAIDNQQSTLKKKPAVDNEYDRKKKEQAYKRLMHLLNQSKFYAKYIVDKIDTANKPVETPPKRGGSRKRKTAKAEKSPPKKRRSLRRAAREYNIQDLSGELEEEVKNHKKKLNLSTEDIENELNTSSDTEEAAAAAVEEETPLYFHGELRPYQKEGLKWLKILYENGLNGILADEMGLGKTIQVIALYAHLIEKKQPGPFLVIAPLSTIPNWVSEFERFAPDLPVVLYYGTKAEREKLVPNIKRMYSVNGYMTQPIVLTTYENPWRDAAVFRKFTWHYIVLDEAQRIKNSKCLLNNILKSLRSLNRLLLTGTPLQNDLTELWSLLHFLMPDIFDDLDVFEAWFDVEEFQHSAGAQRVLDQEREKNVMSSLREILRPFMLRRLKEDVCMDIPQKKEILVYTPITQLQRELYMAVLNRDISLLHKVEPDPVIVDNVSGTRPKRKCAVNNKYSGVYVDPYDVEKRANIAAESAVSTPKKEEQKIASWERFTDVNDRNRHYLLHLAFGNRGMMYREILNHPYLIHWPLNDAGLPTVNEDLVAVSGKMMVLDAMLKKLHDQGHKVLIFSTLTMMLDVIEDYLTLRPWKWVSLDGRMKIDQRKVNIADFNSDPSIFLFLISTRAGGVGLNLAAADTVIMFDSDWNPQVDIQAMARCHRIGQTRPVVVYKLCAKGTFDERVIRRAEAKRKLEKMVISKDLEFNLNNAENLLELKRLLERSDLDEGINLAEKDVFTEAELDKILDRSDLQRPVIPQASTS